MKTLIKFTNDWADEFQADGFMVIDDPDALASKYAEVKKWFDKHDKSLDLYFGTNEGWELSDEDEWLECYTSTEISDEHAQFLIETFPACYNHTQYGSGGYGLFIWPSDLDEE